MRTNSLRDTHTHTTYIFYTISDVSISQMLLQRRHLYNHKHTPRDKHTRYFVALFVQSRTKKICIHRSAFTLSHEAPIRTSDLQIIN